jgi:hypothetical protein
MISIYFSALALNPESIPEWKDEKRGMKGELRAFAVHKSVYASSHYLLACSAKIS